MKTKRQRVRFALLLISFLLVPVTLFYFSPYLSVMAPFLGIINGSLIVFASLFLISLFFGRIFCGWACPMGGLQETCFRVNNKRAKGGKLNLIKFIFVWIPWLIAVITMSILSNGIKKIDFTIGTHNGVSIGEPHSYFILYIVLTLIVVLALVTGRRGFCHYGCWIAPFMIIGSKIKQTVKYPSLHLRADNKKCIHCKLCTKNCPMSLDVEQMVSKNRMYNSECILCGMCIDTCPKKVIHYAFVYKRPAKK